MKLQEKIKILRKIKSDTERGFFPPFSSSVFNKLSIFIRRDPAFPLL